LGEATVQFHIWNKWNSKE